MSNKKKPTGSTNAATNRREALRQQREADAKRERNQRIAIIASVVVALALIITIAVIAINGAKKTQFDGEQIDPPHLNAARSGLEFNAEKAKPDAPEIVIYQDYQCPLCKEVSTAIDDQLSTLNREGKIRLRYSILKFLDINLRNDSSTKAARAATCADVVGKFHEMNSAIYAGQPAREGDGYTQEQLTQEFPSSAGITGDDLQTWKSCYSEGKTDKVLDEMTKKADDARVAGTPTYLIDGKKWDFQGVEPGMSPERLLEVIENFRK